MTFLEAAIEILRDETDALHFSAIAEKAVERNLLSHVGRDPQTAMRSCLTSAVRRKDSVLVRTKPGHYKIREGAELPERAEVEAAPEATPEPAPKKSRKKTTKKKTKKVSKKTTSRRRKKTDEPAAEEAEAGEPPAQDAVEAADEPAVEAEAPATGDEAPADGDDSSEASEAAEGSEDSGGKRKRRWRSSRYGVRGEAPMPQSVAVKPSRRGSDNNKRNQVLQKVIEFEAPEGSGMEGVTDVALVMANAMSRIVSERPELRGEFENMQQSYSESKTQSQNSSSRDKDNSRETRDNRDNKRDSNSGNRKSEDRSRRRRRRRRRSRRVEWSDGSVERKTEGQTVGFLLDQTAEVLADAGSRSLHIRQIAENLADRGVLGGEISEIERAVTSAMLSDVHTRKGLSRFVARGDARYQLRGSRLPEPVAAAEKSLHNALEAVRAEVETQLVQWVASLGLRALESLVRIYLEREGLALQASLPPGRGLGKLIVIDSDSDEDDPRALVWIAPRKTSIEPGSWQSELERSGCGSMILFTMTEQNANVDWGDARVIHANDLAGWLRQQNLAVEQVPVTVTVLDPTFIESISGLDT